MKLSKSSRVLQVTISALLLVFGATVGVYAASGAFESMDQEMVMVKLEKPLTLEQTSDSEAVIATINKKALEVGLNHLRIHGSNRYAKSEDGAVRTTVEWHSISLKTDKDGITEPLPKPLASQFKTYDPKAEAGTRLTARGDWEAVLKSLADLQAKNSNKVVKVENAEEEEEGDDKGLESVSAPSSTLAPEATSPYDSVSTEIMSSSYDNCPDFIDEASKKVFEQKRKTTTGESGTVYEEGLCTNTGVFWGIEEVDGECTFQFNFEDGVATEMVQWQYDKDGQIIEIEGCRASNSTYPISDFSDVCDVTIDEANSKVFPQSRLGIEVNGVRYYGTECQPMGTVEWPLYEEKCLDADNATSYHHDYTNNISYPLVRKYYVKDEGGAAEEKVYVNECSISGTESYVHKYETAACGWQMDDALLQAQQLSTTFIETPDGDIEIQGCAARTAPVPYAYVGLETNSTAFHYTGVEQTFTAPAGVTSLKYTLVAGGEAGGQGWFGDCYDPSEGKSGGAAGERFVNQNLIIQDGESIPVYVGMKGWMEPFAGAWGTEYNTIEPEESYIGSNDTSFAKITAATKRWAGTANSARYGGQGAEGYYLDADSPSATDGKKGDVAFCTSTTGASGWCIGGDGGEGYGAGGGGAPGGLDGYCNNQRTPYYTYGGNGADGLAILSFEMMKYMRPDSTYYKTPVTN